jgi:hypothetical protein
MMTDVIRSLIDKRSIRHVVMTNYTMAAIGGSQIVLRDIASILVSAGAQVTIVSPAVGEPMASLMATVGASTVNLCDPDISAKLPRSTDLLLGLHWPVVGMVTLHHKMRFRHLVLMSLSPYEPVEALSILTDDADALLVNSRENLDHHRQMTHDSAFTDRIVVFPNSLPTTWFEDVPPPPKTLRRVLFVSNRRSARLDLLKDTLHSAGVAVLDIGMGRESRLVDTALVDDHDAVITIGHSVQKAMARQRPVFVFDRFGGPGWVTMGNFDDLARFNFAGRGLPSLAAVEAPAAFLKGHEAACAQSSDLSVITKEQFSLEVHVERVLDHLKPDVAERQPAGTGMFAALRASQAVFSARFPQSFDPARLAPGVNKGRLRLMTDLPARRGSGLLFSIDQSPHDAVLFGAEADFLIGGLVMAEDGSTIKLRAERDDGLAFTAGAFTDSPGLSMQFPGLLSAKRARFNLGLVAKAEGSNFTLMVEAGGRVHLLGRIEARKISL